MWGFEQGRGKGKGQKQKVVRIPYLEKANNKAECSERTEQVCTL